MMLFTPGIHLANSRFGKAIGIPRLTAYITEKIATTKSSAAYTPKTAATQKFLNKTNPKAVFTPSSTQKGTPSSQQSPQPTGSNVTNGNIRPIGTRPVIPMEGINTHTYSATISVQESYLNNPYWKSIPEYTMAADNLAIQSIRSRLNAFGIHASRLTDAEIIAIRQYTTRAYVPLNSGLRSGGNVAELAKNAAIIQQTTRRGVPAMTDVDVFGKTLLSGLNKLPPYKGTVYRGEGIQRIGQFANMKPGEIWIEPAPLSTTYMLGNEFTKPVRFELEVFSGIKIDELSTIASELEVLMKPGSKFEFISLTKDPKSGNFIIRAKEIK